MTSRTFSFFRIEPDALSCHYELIYAIEEARTQRLALLLPKDTLASLSITALDGVKLKEFGSEMAGEQRRWNVLLAEAQRGRVRLAGRPDRFHDADLPWPALLLLRRPAGGRAGRSGGRLRSKTLP